MSNKATQPTPPLPTAKPTANRLLAALPEAEYQRLEPHLEFIDLPLGLAVYESGTQLSHVYFQTDGIVSLLHVLEDGSSAEIAVTGSEGMVGISLFMGGGHTSSRAVVQCHGHAYRLRANYMLDEFERGGFLHNLLLRYTQALITQMAQTAVCNRHHSVDQQLCRWLLLSLDRLPGNEIDMTQELIANMLGVRREGVTAAAGHLRRAGLVSYKRGLITVLDRAGLEKRVCECYAVVKRETDRLLTIREKSHARPRQDKTRQDKTRQDKTSYRRPDRMPTKYAYSATASSAATRYRSGRDQRKLLMEVL